MMLKSLQIASRAASDRAVRTPVGVEQEFSRTHRVYIFEHSLEVCLGRGGSIAPELRYLAQIDGSEFETLETLETTLNYPGFTSRYTTRDLLLYLTFNLPLMAAKVTRLRRFLPGLTKKPSVIPQ